MSLKKPQLAYFRCKTVKPDSVLEGTIQLRFSDYEHYGQGSFFGPCFPHSPGKEIAVYDAILTSLTVVVYPKIIEIVFA